MSQEFEQESEEGLFSKAFSEIFGGRELTQQEKDLLKEIDNRVASGHVPDWGEIIEQSRLTLEQTEKLKERLERKRDEIRGVEEELEDFAG